MKAHVLIDLQQNGTRLLAGFTKDEQKAAKALVQDGLATLEKCGPRYWAVKLTDAGAAYPPSLPHMEQCGWNDAQAGKPMRTLGLNYEAAYNYRQGYNRLKSLSNKG